MTVKKTPERWQGSDAAIKAVQVAFDVNDRVLEAVRRAAFDSGLSTSDQIRTVLGLTVIRQPQRPRLTVSLSTQDYEVLARKYELLPENRLAIKERALAELIAFGETGISGKLVADDKKTTTSAVPAITPPPLPRRKR